MKDSSKENLVYLKFDYGEALESKREILQSQKNFLILNETINECLELKKNSLQSKNKLHRKLRELSNSIKKLQDKIPEVELPPILKKEGVVHKDIVQKKSSTKFLQTESKSYGDDIESQLREIQDKLNRLNDN